MPPPARVADALQAATAYWQANERTQGRGVDMMPIRASRCADILGRSRKLATLTAADGARLLAELRRKGGRDGTPLARSTVGSYYAAGRRMLKLAGVPCHDWPKAPTAPRKVRPAITSERVDALIAALHAEGHSDTASLVVFMRDTGCRVGVEAMGQHSIKDLGDRVLIVDGKGGHQREIPLRTPMNGRPWMGVCYETHLRRMKATGLDIDPHDLRRYFVTRAYYRSGKDIRVAQALAGHADPGTTAGYIGVDFEALRGAV